MQHHGQTDAQHARDHSPPHLQLCQVARHCRQVPVLVVAQVQQLQPHEVANAAGQAAQPVARHQQLLQGHAAPDHARHAGEPVAAAVEHLQRAEGTQGLGQRLQPVAGEAQDLHKATAAAPTPTLMNKGTATQKWGSAPVVTNTHTLRRLMYLAPVLNCGRSNSPAQQNQQALPLKMNAHAPDDTRTHAP